jgi:hypothetical protein
MADRVFADVSAFLVNQSHGVNPSILQDAVYFRVNAVLSSEPDNPHDVNAIQIQIDGEKVGYVSRQDNFSLREKLNAASVTGDVQCRAEIAGGWNRGTGDAGEFGLRLDLTFPWMFGLRRNVETNIRASVDIKSTGRGRPSACI